MGPSLDEVDIEAWELRVTTVVEVGVPALPTCFWCVVLAAGDR
jgi:hypothetical protein